MERMSQSDLIRWIGEQIRKERISHKLTQEALSEAIGVSRSFISLMENGNKAAKTDTYYQIACALDISLCELFRDEESSAIADEISLLLSDCNSKEARALIEILRTIRIQFSRL